MYWGFALFVRQTGILEDINKGLLTYVKHAVRKNALSLKSCVHTAHVSFPPQMRASLPPSRQSPASTTKQRYLISCRASRPAGQARTRVCGKAPCRVVKSQRETPAMVACPGGPKTRNLHSPSGTWPCLCRGRGTPGQV